MCVCVCACVRVRVYMCVLDRPNILWTDHTNNEETPQRMNTNKFTFKEDHKSPIPTHLGNILRGFIRHLPSPHGGSCGVIQQEIQQLSSCNMQ